MGNIAKDFVKRFASVFIALGLMLLLIFINNIRVSSAHDRLAVQQRELNDIQNKIDIKQSTADNAEQKLVKDTTGLDTDRVNHDNEIALDFLSMIFTWHSADEYDSNRLSMINDYGIAEDSSMLSVLFPADTKVVQVDGSILSYIDTHNINAQFEEMDTYVSGINLGTYSYFTFVTWSSSGETGSEGMSTAVVTYDIDSDGNMSNIAGYTIAR